MPATTKTRRKPKQQPAPAPQPAPAVTPVCVKVVTCRSDCPLYHRPNDGVFPVVCDCGKIGYACGLCLREKRITGCVACMAAAGGN